MAAKKVTADARGVVSFEVDGDTHRMHFSVNALVEVEAVFGGRNITQVGLMLSGGAEAQAIRQAFGAILAQEKNGQALLTKLQPAIEAAAAASTLPEGGPGIANMRSLFRCGLVESEPDLTDQEAGEMMNELGIAKALEIVSVAFNSALAREKTANSRPQKGAGGKAKN